MSAECDRSKVDHTARPARSAGFGTDPLSVPSDQPPNGRSSMRWRCWPRSEPPTIAPVNDSSWRLSRALRRLRGFYRPSVMRAETFGGVPNATISAGCRVACRCLEWPEVASGGLRLAATAIRYSFSRGASRRRPEGEQFEDAPRDLKPTWRRGDRSPREMNPNYARRLSLSRTSFEIVVRDLHSSCSTASIGQHCGVAQVRPTVRTKLAMA